MFLGGCSRWQLQGGIRAGQHLQKPVLRPFQPSLCLMEQGWLDRSHLPAAVAWSVPWVTDAERVMPARPRWVLSSCCVRVSERSFRIVTNGLFQGWRKSSVKSGGFLGSPTQKVLDLLLMKRLLSRKRAGGIPEGRSPVSPMGLSDSVHLRLKSWAQQRRTGPPFTRPHELP